MCIIEFVVLLLVFVSGVCLLSGCFWFWLAGVCICILLFVVFGFWSYCGQGIAVDIHMYMCIYAHMNVYLYTYIYIYIHVLGFVFCVLGCLLVDLNVMCVYKILLFLWFWLCFCICMSIYMCSSVLIWGWDRVVLGMCLFRAGADILVVGVWGQNH